MDIFISLNFAGMARKEYYCNAMMTLAKKEVNGFSSVKKTGFPYTM